MGGPYGPFSGVTYTSETLIRDSFRFVQTYISSELATAAGHTVDQDDLDNNRGIFIKLSETDRQDSGLAIDLYEEVSTDGGVWSRTRGSPWVGGTDAAYPTIQYNNDIVGKAHVRYVSAPNKALSSAAQMFIGQVDT